MIGTNKLELNNETIAEAVQAHLNEHVMRERVRVIKVDREYLPGNSNEQRWVAYLEPVESAKSAASADGGAG